MLVTELDKQRLPLIDQLLRAQRYDLLDNVLAEQASRGLLDDATLAAARALDLLPAIIYLATLGIENLPEPGARALWLEVYRTLGRNAETEGFQALAEQLPIKWVVRNAISGRPADKNALRRCKGRVEDWLSAFDLTLDHRSFALTEQLTVHLLAQKASVDTWLTVVAHLIERHEILKPQREVAPLARSLVHICKRLPDVPELIFTRSLLAAQAARYFHSSGLYAEAGKIAALIKDPGLYRVRMHALAEASCRMGDLPGCIQLMDELLACIGEPSQVNLLQHEREVSGVLNTSGQYDSSLAAQALVALQVALLPTGMNVFLVSGTLLGYARNGQLLAHDKDIDVGVLGWESQFDIVLALLRSGQFDVNTSTMEGQKTYLLSVRHLATGIPVDVFIYHPEGGQYVTGVQADLGYLQKFGFTPFELEEVDFLGIKIHVPSDVDRNLCENYGNWREPDPGYISHLESPSTLDVGGLVYQLVGRVKSLEAVLCNKRKTLLRALDCMERVQQHPCGMTPGLIAYLRGQTTLFVEPHDSSRPVPLEANS